jgi:hypothetical protein
MASGPVKCGSLSRGLLVGGRRWGFFASRNFVRESLAQFLFFFFLLLGEVSLALRELVVGFGQLAILFVMGWGCNRESMPFREALSKGHAADRAHARPAKAGSDLRQWRYQRGVSRTSPNGFPVNRSIRTRSQTLKNT